MRPPPPPYRIIFNWDGTPHRYSEYPQSLEQLLDLIYAPLENTQVGALFWCLGIHEARWPSRELPVVGESEERFYTSVKSKRGAESVRALFDRGEDLYGALVQRGRSMGLHVYCSIRMNDNHFWSDTARQEQPLKPEEMERITRPGLTRLRKEHPEWCLGPEQAPRWAATSWNLAIPEVREHLLQYIAEACRLADWDGVELDWQRHAFHLPESDAYRLRYTLTDLQRAVRQVADQIARERKRPFYVAVRVGASMETCRRIGYDIPRWMRQDLCDLVATGANSGTDPGVEIEEFLRLGGDGGIPLYPGLDSHGENGAGRLIPAGLWRQAWYRGLARDFYERGARGIHIFNWHATSASHRPLLTTLGEPATLERRNKVYAAVKRHIRGRTELRYGAERDDRLGGEVPVDLYPTMTGDGPRFHLSIYDAVVEEWGKGTLGAVELQVELAHCSPADRFEVAFDGELLDEPARRSVAGENPADPAEVDESTWLVWGLQPEKAAKGQHQIQLRLVERDIRLRVPVVVENVEIHLNYKA